MNAAINKNSLGNVSITKTGKRGRHVPCLIPRDTREAMEILRTNREKAGILPENPYFFALPEKGQSYLDPFKALNNYVANAELEMPEFVTSTKLRKYLGEHHIHCFLIILSL